MSKKDLERVATTSPDLVQERLEALRALIPEAFGEDGLDLPKLRAAVGDFVEDAPERYQFSWSGKQQAIQAFQIPSRATLVPDRDHSVNWDETGHVFIEGENLEVLKLLYKSHFGRVKCIYIDPPYNTGNDFVYPDDYSDPLEQYLRITGQKDAEGNLLTSNPETAGRYHSAWLSMMYPRLFLARQLLTDDGVIFVSIDDNEVHNLRMLMNEVFGEENLLAQVVWQRIYSGKADATHFGRFHEYLLCYARNATVCDIRLLPRTEEMNARYTNPDGDPRGPWLSNDLTAAGERSGGHYPVTSPTGKLFDSAQGKHWLYARPTMEKLMADNRIWFGPNGTAFPRLKRFLNDVQQGRRVNTMWLHSEVGHTDEASKETAAVFPETRKIFDTPKPTRFMERVLQIATDPSSSDLIVDFFAGSCTTAQAALELNRKDGGNRRFVVVQLPEPLDQPQTFDDGTVLTTIADIGRERIRRTIARMREADNGKPDTSKTEHPEDLGFRAYRLEPSTYRAPSEAEAEGTAALFTAPLVDGWTPDNLLYEIALKEGFDLSAQIEQVADLKTNTVYRITDPYKEQTCLVCLDDTLNAKTAKALGLTREDLFICLDAALDDTLAANLALQCRLKVI